ncbi:MAG: roadblock/LC7 domain-containing protein [Methanosarcinaceae archaeon]|nr:roadblock/LC7 domain-containing protein [Methanosarcinaceae archaeon]
MHHKFMETLEALGKSANVKASAIVSNEGLLIASNMDPKMHAETFAAMTALLRNTAQMTMETVGKGVPDRLIVDINDGTRLVTVGAGSRALLTACIKRSDGDMGLDLAELQYCADKIRSIIG